MNISQKRSQDFRSAYPSMMDTVGTRGAYMWVIIAINTILSMHSGIMLLGVAYYLVQPQYANCPHPYSTPQQCLSYVCSLPQSHRIKYAKPITTSLITFGTKISQQMCNNSNVFSLIKGSVFIGSIFGFFFSGFLADNMGRKRTLILNHCIAIMATLGLLLSNDIPLIALSVFMIGFGSVPCSSILFSIKKEAMDTHMRHSMQILVQLFCCLGGLILVGLTYWLQNSYTIFWIYALPILVISLFLTLFYLQQTPRFLVKFYSAQEVRHQMRYIASLNKRLPEFEESQYFDLEYIAELKEKENKEEELAESTMLTYFDLVRYASLRKLTICTTILFSCSSIIYFLPMDLVQRFGYNFYLNGVLISVSQLLSFPFILFLIENIKRRDFIVKCLIAVMVFSLLLLCIDSSSVCTGKCRSGGQMFLFFAIRFAVSLEFPVLFIFIFELYPSQVATLSYAVGAIMWNFPNIFLAQLIHLCNTVGFPPIIISLIVTGVSIIPAWMLPSGNSRLQQQKVEELRDFKPDDSFITQM